LIDASKCPQCKAKAAKAKEYKTEAKEEWKLYCWKGPKALRNMTGLTLDFRYNMGWLGSEAIS
jgi:hypothetical protein